MSSSSLQTLGLRPTVACVCGAVALFHVAQAYAPLAWLVAVMSGCLFALHRLATARQAFYVGLVVGLGCYVPQTLFLWTIFSAAAVPLWLILSVWTALFVLLLRQIAMRFGSTWASVLAPFLWTGLEYFRSEVYWLKFAWLTLGGAFTGYPGLLRVLGIYGAGFLAMAFGALASHVVLTLRDRSRVGWGQRLWRLALLMGIAVAMWLGSRERSIPDRPVEVAGIQLEFPGLPQVMAGLEKVRQLHPGAELIVLSEYTFDGEIPEKVRTWCRRHGKWLIAGGKRLLDPNAAPLLSVESAPRTENLKRTDTDDTRPYRNTAFVVSTNGEVVFEQAKSVPIQFFHDGLPAASQALWQSPWGPIGIAICYDLSYRHVMDSLVLAGARALIIPAMDVEQWGLYEHQLNARMARIRAAEYGLPVFRIASSGISQLTDHHGREMAVGPFPGDESVLGGTLEMRSKGSVPSDRYLAWVSIASTCCLSIAIVYLSLRQRKVADAPGPMAAPFPR